MSDAKLILHAGGREVSREELDNVEAPPGTSSWFPLAHRTVLGSVETALTSAGFAIETARYGLARDNQRMFTTLRTTSAIAVGVSLAVGIRNSTDKSFPIAFCAGSNVAVCDNLLFRSEILVSKKHTRHGEVRFVEGIAASMRTLAQFQAHETERVKQLVAADLTDERAESLLLRAFDAKVISHLVLPKALAEWRKPSFPDFEPRNAWSLTNALTTAMGPRMKSNPAAYAASTLKLSALIDQAIGIKPFAPLAIAEGPNHETAA